MRKAKVIVPAVSANLGPGVESLALALALHVMVLFNERSDTRLVIEAEGEDSAELEPDCLNPVMYAAVRVFQCLEDSPLGLHVRIRNSIPLRAGLGASAAMTVAGLVGANALMSSPLQRDDLIALGAGILGHPGEVIAAMLGGLTVCTTAPIFYRRLDMAPLKVVVVVPDLPDYSQERTFWPEIVALSDAIFNLGRLALVIEALRAGDFDLLAHTLDDRLLWPYLRDRIPGFAQAAEAGRRAGALGVTISGEGPALLAFALVNHRKIAVNMETAFRTQGIDARSWTLPVDTQGVVVSAAESLD